MTASLFVVGVSWRTASVSLREQLAFADQEVPAALAELRAVRAIGEALLISTCNRVEIYGATARDLPVSAVTEATAEARRFLARSRRVSSEELSAAAYERVEVEAVQHVFSVAASLDSMVVGEAQILGQLKDAYGAAMRAGATGPLLGRCLERAFGVAKRVRAETGIARGAANVSSVAVELARMVFGELAGKSVLVIGAGKMSALAARHLHADGAGSIFVVNRSVERAESLAAEIDGVARPWEQLEALLTLCDVVITSTGAREPVLHRQLLKPVMRARRHRPLVIIDIAVPRDVAADVAGVDGIYLFDIDDLQRVVASNLEERAREAEAAQRIVSGEVEQFERWLRSHHVVPTIRQLRAHFAAISAAETEKVIQSLRADHTPEQRERAIRRLGELITSKLLHTPMNVLKHGDERQLDTLVDVTRQLFGLAEEADDDPAVGELPAAVGEAVGASDTKRTA
jgi:glutamyl-tRNA reductase